MDYRWSAIMLMLDIARFGSLDAFRQPVDAVSDFVNGDPPPEATWREFFDCAERFGGSQ
ncbi:MAG: hypothetical protein OXF90_01910 [Chloroflexi bacterium]|nr:hypothetical protein [Chloroflexota bacterium]